jgi:hypothetical protein
VKLLDSTSFGIQLKPPFSSKVIEHTSQYFDVYVVDILGQ